MTNINERKKLQQKLEQYYSKTYQSKYIKQCFKDNGLGVVVDEMVKQIHEVCCIPQPNRNDLREVHRFFLNTDPEPLLWKMITTLYVNQSMTVAALAGVVYHNMDLENKHQNFKAIEYLLTVLDASKLAYSEITKGEECLFKAAFELPEDMRERVSNQGYPLPLIIQPMVVSNTSIGYTTFAESVLAGGKLKHHDKDVVLSSINRANSVPYMIETRIEKLVEFKFDPSDKIKKNGLPETFEDKADRYANFKILEQTIPEKTQLILDHGNRFFLAHRVDNRIRRYVKGFEFNYQGNKYIKARVQFADPELVEGEW